MRRARARSGSKGDHAIIAALGIVLLLISALTLHAARIERAQRETVSRSLQQLAGSVAWQYAQRASADLAHSARMTMLPVVDMQVMSSRAPLGAASDLLDRRIVRGPICPLPIEPIGFARFDLRSNALELSGTGWVPSDSDRVVALLAQLVSPTGELVRHHGEAALLVLEGGGRPNAAVLLTAIARTSAHRPLAVYAALARPEEVGDLLTDITRTLPLLPPDVARGLPNDSLLSITVSTGAGYPLLAGHPVERHASTMTSAQAGNLRIDVALLPRTIAAISLPQSWSSGSPILGIILVIAAALLGLAMVQSRRRAEFARARGDFVAGVTHELHTPLALIHAHAETLMLEREASREERHRFLEIVLRESGRLTRLVDGILDFSRLERHAANLTIRPVLIAPLMRAVAYDFRLAAKARESTIDVDANDELVVSADADALRRVMINLVDNALKHGPIRQCIRIEAATVGTQVHVTVDDQGRAIAVADRERAFERYVRLPSGRLPNRAGSGIGLAVVRELCRLQSATVVLEASPDGGTRARVVLPAASLDDEMPSNPSYDATLVSSATASR
jgi:signal transduction histidine kinase